MSRRRKRHLLNWVITIGVVTATLLSLYPGLTSHAMVIGLMANLIWIWE